MLRHYRTILFDLSDLPPRSKPECWHISMLARCGSCYRNQRAMNHHGDTGGKLQATLTLLVMGGMLSLATLTGFAKAQDKPKSDAKDEKKTKAKPTPKDEKKVESKPTVPAQAQPNPDDPAKLKEQIAGLRKEVATLKLKVTTLELEKLGAIVMVDKAKDGKETATVNILKKWSGDKDALQLLKKVPNLEVVYIDNAQVNDVAVAPLKELTDLSALTLMSPQFTDAGLDNLKGLTNLTMLFLTSSKVGDKGLPSLKGLKNLQVLALSRTEVTDTGLDSLKDLKSLKSIYLIGTKVTPQAVEKLKQTIPGVAVYK
jgi:hypothetical protein